VRPAAGTEQVVISDGGACRTRVLAGQDANILHGSSGNLRQQPGNDLLRGEGRRDQSLHVGQHRWARGSRHLGKLRGVPHAGLIGEDVQLAQAEGFALRAHKTKVVAHRRQSLPADRDIQRHWSTLRAPECDGGGGVRTSLPAVAVSVLVRLPAAPRCWHVARVLCHGNIHRAAHQ